MDKLSPEERSKNMKAIKASGSKIETKLAKALFSFGVRYRKNDVSVFGKPDLTIKKYKIAIFVDSEFWHGKDWEVRKFDHKSNQEFWYSKIERNIERDKEVNQKLLDLGWEVLRFWGKDIILNINECIEKVQTAINENKGKNIN